MADIEKRIFECSKAENKGDFCPVAKKFKENNRGERPIPEAYLGNPKARLMIIGINPGRSGNYLSSVFEEYQRQIKDYLRAPTWRRRGGWVYDDVIKVFGYPPREKDGVVVTNLVHCPTTSWNRSNEGELSGKEKIDSVKLCSRFCLDIINEVDPELVILHGPDAVRFFSELCGWNVQDPKSMEIIDVKKCNGRNFILSPHFVRLIFCSKNPQKESYATWRKLRDTNDKLKKEEISA